jgi:TetR/AcrR family transcriptional regulator
VDVRLVRFDPIPHPYNKDRRWMAGMTAARRNDPEGSRGAILDAAETLFLEAGFAGTSMSEIAKASGVTKSLIHHHFGSKDALWQEVKRTRFSAYYDRQLDLLVNIAPTDEMLRSSMTVYFEFLQDNPRVLRIMWWMLLSPDVEAWEMMEELRDLGVQRIEAAQKAGILRDDIEAQYILIGFLGLVHAWFTESEWATRGATPSAYLEAAWKMFASGVVTGPGAGG